MAGASALATRLQELRNFVASGARISGAQPREARI